MDDDNRDFEFIRLTDDAIDKANKVGYKFKKLLDELEFSIPPGRELALVKTKLQEACYWAKKAISLDPSNWKSNEV